MSGGRAAGDVDGNGDSDSESRGELGMAIQSRRGLVVGLGIAFAVPVASFLLPLLIQNGIAPYDAARSMLDAFGFLTWASLAVLGPLGIVIAARSVGVHGVLGWLATLMLAGPAYLVVWFAGAVSLSGALGNPF